MSTNTAPSLPENRPSDKELALLLISRELQNTRLLHSLRRIGFETASYYLDFRRTIFSLMDFGPSMDEDQLCSWYCDLLYEMAYRIDPHDEKALKEQACVARPTGSTVSYRRRKKGWRNSLLQENPTT